MACRPHIADGTRYGASLNVMFMDHFERVARGHFAIRRLERAYGRELIGELYRAAATGAAPRTPPAMPA